MPNKQIFLNYALLTYPTHLDKVAYSTWLQSVVPCKNIQIAHETGGEGDYNHTHVVIHTSARYVTTDQSLRDFDYEGNHPNIKILKGTKAYKDALKYISKEDKAVQVEEPSICDRVWACETLEEALSTYCKKPSDATGIIALFEAKPKPPGWRPVVLRGWQETFYDLIKDSSSERTVYWIHSSGNSGKTFFMKYMMQNHPTDTVLLADAYLSKDIALVFKGAIDQGSACKYVLFDCSRAFSFPDQFYTILERVKDGLMTSTKYQSSTLMFNNDVLVVMANQWPDITKLTYDRWSVFDIDGGELKPIETKDIPNNMVSHVSSSI